MIYVLYYAIAILLYTSIYKHNTLYVNMICTILCCYILDIYKHNTLYVVMIYVLYYAIATLLYASSSSSKVSPVICTILCYCYITVCIIIIKVSPGSRTL